MSSDIKTLADAQPGGRVRLGDQAELDRLEFQAWARWFVAPVERDAAGDYVSDFTRGLWCAWQAALSAQPSPGGQDALRSWFEAWADGSGRSIARFNDGGYCDERTVSAWIAVCALAARQPVGLSDTFQHGVSEWMGQCFLPSLYCNMTERGDRLLEEVLELLQAHGYDKARVPTLVDYVFSRPVGDPAQEVGGVMVTLAGYCWVAGLDMHVHGHAELARISHPEVMAKIRAKQEAKNALRFDTPLPGNAARQPVGEPVGEPVGDDAASEAFGEFADDYLTDGNGYAPASTYEACSKAFTAAWPDRVAATAAARAELKRLHGDDRTVGARRAEALNRAAARDDAEDDAAPPAQAVDLVAVRYALDAAEGLAVACASVDGFSREEIASAGREMRKQFADARALIDSQGAR